ncbi:hypothetical protein C0993_011043, partial [Termitomyces sp. T159_Od127]
MTESITDVPAQEGTLEWQFCEKDGQLFKCHTYYKVFGDLKAGTPLVVLHGGPGLCHNYLMPFSDLASRGPGIPVILYDQLGNGRSTHLKKMPEGFSRDELIDLFIDELVNLLENLEIKDSFSLAGHSWGGILASEFEVRRKPTGLKRLILTNSLASVDLWFQSNLQLLQAFPSSVQEGIIAGMTNPPQFFAALQEFHAVHGCTIKPFPPDYIYTLEQVFGPDGNPTVAAAGILQKKAEGQEGWSIIDKLFQIRVPTFVINGRKDISQDFVVRPFFDRIQKVKWVTFENSSHAPFYEERVKYMSLVADFLHYHDD